mgnify:CR=1 FL=1
MRLSAMRTWRLHLDFSGIHAGLMAKTLFNLRMLGDRSRRERLLSWFLDGYGQSLDLTPECHRPSREKDAEALWQDFVKIAEDMHKATGRIEGEAARRRNTAFHG